MTSMSDQYLYNSTVLYLSDMLFVYVLCMCDVCAVLLVL